MAIQKSWQDLYRAAAQTALNLRVNEHKAGKPLRVDRQQCDILIGAFNDYWRHQADRGELADIVKKISADLPRIRLENGTEMQSVILSPPARSQPDYDVFHRKWEEADEFQRYLALSLSEIEFRLEGNLPTASEEWREQIESLQRLHRDYLQSPPVTRGARTLSREHYASESLALTEDIERLINMTVSTWARKGNRGEQDTLREHLSELMSRVLHLGILARAVAGKAVEADAVRGRKTLKASQAGGSVRRLKSADRRNDVIAFIAEQLSKGENVSQACRLAAKKFGGSADSIRRTWSREKKKVGTTPPLSQPT